MTTKEHASIKIETLISGNEEGFVSLFNYAKAVKFNPETESWDTLFKNWIEAGRKFNKFYEENKAECAETLKMVMRF